LDASDNESERISSLLSFLSLLFLPRDDSTSYTHTLLLAKEDILQQIVFCLQNGLPEGKHKWVRREKGKRREEKEKRREEKRREEKRREEKRREEKRREEKRREEKRREEKEKDTCCASYGNSLPRERAKK
jgi:hypothetical protein